MEYRREIDGLRALAVLPVIFFHAGFETFSGGFVGVDVFFVISGYLITSIILSELEQGKFSIINFYERRCRRIFPALLLVMLFCIPFAWSWFLPSDMKDFSQSLVAASIFSSNILFWHESGYFDTAAELKPLLHTWSLAVEEQYYVFFPLFMIFFFKKGRRWILITLGIIFATSLAIAQISANANPAAAFYLLPTRGWELITGAFIAFYLSKDNRKNSGKLTSEAAGYFGVALIFYAVLAFSKATPFPGFHALIPTSGAALIILFATQKTTVGRILGNKVFMGIGLISYSAYLWHQPLFVFARHKSLTEPSHNFFLLLSALAFILAYLSWKFVEAPLRNNSKIKNPSFFLITSISIIFFIIFGMIGHINHGFQFRINSGILSKTPDMTVFDAQVSNCWNSIERSPTTSSSCTLGKITSPLIFGLLGDSHAGSFLHELNQEAIRHNYSGRNFSYLSCPPLNSAKSAKQNPEELTCFNLRKNFFKTLNASPSSLPDVFIISSRWSLLMEKERFKNSEGGTESGDSWLWNIPQSSGNYSSDMRSEIIESIQMILRAGKIVILIYPIPEMGWDVPRVLLRHFLANSSVSPETASVSYDEFLERSKSATEALNAIEGGENLIRIRPEKIFCNTFVKNRCAAHLNGQALYFDDDHLSNKGAELVLKEVIPVLSHQRH